MRLRFLFLLGPLFVGGDAAAEQVTMALSTNEIRIGSNFTGATVTVFGVIGRDAATVSRPAGYDVAVVMRGPPETTVVRRKDRLLGIWANGASETIIAAPSFYTLDTTRPLADITSQIMLERLQLGFENIGFTYARRAVVNDPGAAEFRDAFVRLKQEENLYVFHPGGVSFIGDLIFRATIPIPATAPDGRYTVQVFLFSGGVLVGRAGDVLDVVKVGFEQYVFTTAHENALLYGLACVGLALSIGWLGGVIFRRD